MGRLERSTSEPGGGAGAETRRLAALREYHLLDAAFADSVDTTLHVEAIARLAKAVAGVAIATVNLIDEDEQCPLSAVGAPTLAVPREQSLCARHFTSGRPVHVPDLRAHADYLDHPWVDGSLGSLRSYTSVPLVAADGHALGTLCAIDVVPRRLDEEQLARLSDLAGLLVTLFERHRQAVVNAQLAVEADEQRHLAQSSMVEQRRRAEHLAQLADASQTLATAEDPRTAICHAARRLAGADAAYLLQPDGLGHLVSTATVGFATDPQLRLDVRAGRSLPSTTFQTRRQVFVADVAHHPDADPRLIEISGTVSAVWQPVLLSDGTCTGVLGIVWRSSRSDLDPVLASMLQTLAREAAHTLERADLLAQLREASERDSLTGVGNRRRWDRIASREVDRAERTGEPLTFALIDLDHFKSYNDAYGHPAGDDLLREFAAATVAQLRPVDSVARWGGEEFAVALPGCSVSSALEVADRIRAAVPHAQTATVGLAQWTPGVSAATVLARADAALYRGKRNGRNTTVVSDQGGRGVQVHVA